MKLKIIIISFLIFFISITLTNADKITLKNGHVIEGNIVEVYDEEKPSILFDIIIDGQLANMKVRFYGTEISIIEIDNLYRGLKPVELTQEEREKNIRIADKRERKAREIDDRVSSKMNQRRQMRIAQKHRDKDREHEKEVIKIRHDNQKDLITHSQNELVGATIKIEDTGNSQNNYNHHDHDNDENDYKYYE